MSYAPRAAHRPVSRFLAGTVLTCSFAVIGASCTNPAAGLVVTVETDVPLPKDVNQIELQVTANGTQALDSTYQVGEGFTLIPATLTLLPGSNAAEPVTIRLLAYQGTLPDGGSNVVMLRETITTIPTSRVATLLMPIQWLSFGMVTGGSDVIPGQTSAALVQSSCPDGQTADEGSCVSATIDGATLPTYDPTAIFGGGSGPGNGQCFDLLGCFTSSTVVDVETSGCTVDDPGGDQVNVAMVLAPSADDGQLSVADGYLVPLPFGGPGWQRNNGTLSLPKAVCTRLASKEVTGVRVSTSCPSATPDSPLCGPWCSVTGTGAQDGGGVSDVTVPTDGTVRDSATDSSTSACTGRAPSTSVLTGMVTDGQGVLQASPPYPNVILSELVDGYAVQSGPAAFPEAICESNSGYTLELSLTPYKNACGYATNDLEVIGAGIAFIQVYSTQPFANGGTYSEVTALPLGVPTTQAPGSCGANGGASSPPCGGTTALTIDTIDAQRVAGQLTLNFDDQAINAMFDVPFCTTGKQSLCCVGGGGGSVGPPDSGEPVHDAASVPYDASAVFDSAPK